MLREIPPSESFRATSAKGMADADVKLRPLEYEFAGSIPAGGYIKSKSAIAATHLERMLKSISGNSEYENHHRICNIFVTATLEPLAGVRGKVVDEGDWRSRMKRYL